MGLDTLLFRLVNALSANPLFDALMPFLTQGERNAAVLVALALGAAWAGRREGRGWRLVLVAGAAFGLGELLGSNLLKPLVARPRPPVVLDGVRLLVGVGPSASFPSAHAVSSAAVASAIAWARPGWAPWVLSYAAVIAYSRVYVGVHYPGDVLGGALLGMALAWALWRATEPKEHR